MNSSRRFSSKRSPSAEPRFERDDERIRWSKVVTAQARIAVGYYDRDDVKQRVLDALIAELARG